MMDYGGWTPPPPPRQLPSRAARATRFLHTHPTRRAVWNWVIWAAVVLVVLGGLGNAAGSAKRPATTGSTPAAAAVNDPAASPSPATSTAAEEPATVSPSRRESIQAKPLAKSRVTSAGIVSTAAGAILPNSRRTPGAINPGVSQATIHSTICVPGWTAIIRPPSSYTTELKTRQLATGYAYHRDQNPSDYEEDHLISLEIGGSPTSAANLWPEPYFATDGARTKDRVENKLHSLICSGVISLATAQHAIARNWWGAYNSYEGVAAPAPAPAPAPATTHHTRTAAPAPVINPGGATALCNDGTYSYAAHHQGACSHHGGVAIFYR